MTTPRRSIRVPDEVWATAQKIALRDGVSVTDLVLEGLGLVEERRSKPAAPVLSMMVREAVSGVREWDRSCKNPKTAPTRVRGAGSRVCWCGAPLKETKQNDGEPE